MRRTQTALFVIAILTSSLSLSACAQADESSTAAQSQPVTGSADNSEPPLGPNAETPQESSESAPQADASAGNPQPQSNYELKRVVVDYKEYQIGENLPQRYLDKAYNIAEWQLRHLPAPEEGSHWTYISSNYLLLDAAGKILRAESGDIYYRG